MSLWRDYMSLWQSSMLRMMGAPAMPVAEPAKGDKRFKDAGWHEHFLFDYVKQSYLITARWLHDQVASVEGMSEPAKKKIDFFTRQYIDALAPSNFALTNPEVFRETVASGGQNLVRGLNNLLDDIERGNGQLQDLDDRLEGVRARRQHRDDAGPGRVPERADAADPVRADDEEGRGSGRC